MEYSFLHLFYRAIKKFGLHKTANFVLWKKYNTDKIKIPIINGMGYGNFFQQTDWLDFLIASFCRQKESYFVDVGVGNGSTLVRVKSFNKSIKYIGFEPNVLNSYYVNQLIRLNKYDNAILIPGALSDKIGTSLLLKGCEDHSGATLIENHWTSTFPIRETVVTLEYDKMFYEEQITFIKIDVEGGELEVVKGMIQSIKKYRPIVVCEILDSPSSEDLKFVQERASSTCKIFEKLNYSIVHIKTNSHDNKIISFKKIETVTIGIWNTESLNLNDYIFVPKEQIDSMITILSTLIYEIG